MKKMVVGQEFIYTEDAAQLRLKHRVCLRKVAENHFEGPRMSRTPTICPVLCLAWPGSQSKANRENNVGRVILHH